VIEAGVGDEEDRMSGIAMTPGSAYDMTPIGNGDGNKTGDAGDNEADTMIEVQVTETNQ